ncbi:BTAD domain-containing putative transcriptional regulator [Streptomyces rectiviolaceus]|uniref:AfsR/SARP family transcriptional regulator n=1 Tax=Streptomyces rectiviolaceus TaxID=332591 RepID=UPI003636535D
MRFRVLGPVRMTHGTPSATKPRAVLATLLMHTNTVVSTHTLIDELWSMEPPRTASTTLQVYVSQLRKALLEGLRDGAAGQPLLTRPPGYLLQVPADDLDLAVFESLRGEGRAAYARREFGEASRLLGSALGLWTGPALAGIPHGPTLETSAIRLNELRTEVLEQRIAADLRLGRHHELAGELLALVNDHPLRETLHGHLMVALYRSGRQSDALQAFHRARRALVDELGVEPGPVLKQLLERILASDPSLSWRESETDGEGGAGASDSAGSSVVPGSSGAVAHAGPPVWLPPTVADFTGRERHLSVGARALAGEIPSVSRVLSLSGRAGAGKTALAVQLAHDSAELFPDGRVLVNLRDAGGRAVEPGKALVTLLRRLRTPATEAAEGAGDRLPTTESELTDLLHRRTEGRRMLLVLDDAVSEAQVRPVLSGAVDSTVLLTSRRTLGALEGARHLVVDVLSAEEAERLLVSCGGPRMREDPDAVAEIARLCGNLPLALRVAAAGLAARPHWTAGGLARRLGDERTRLAALALGDLDVRSSLLAVYRDVGDEERHAFRMLGLAPLPDFPLWSAAALLSTDLPGAERHVDELVRAHLLEARQRPGRLTRCATASIRCSGRWRWRYLPRRCRSRCPGRRSGSAVPSWPWPGTRTGCLRRAVTSWSSRQGRRPGSLRGSWWARPRCSGSRRRPPAFWRRCARPTVRGCGSRAARSPSAAAGYYEANALWDDWQSSHELALDAARQAGDGPAEAVITRSLGDLAWQRHETSLAVDRYRFAWHLFTRHGRRVAAGRCQSGESDVLLGLGRVARAERGYARALSVSHAHADARGSADALRGLALVCLREGRTEEALARLEACESAARFVGDERWRAYARRTAAAVRASTAAGRDPVPAGMPLEVRPGVWLFSPGHTGHRAA